MPEYRRAFLPGGTFFFTAVTDRRRPIFADALAIDLLRQAMAHVQSRHPFVIDAAVVLPDHVHCIWSLPDGDADFSTRWRLVKARFTQLYLRSGGRQGLRSPSRAEKGERGVWQRRFWEHTIRDLDDYVRHVDYIHYNPVRHGLAACPHAWAATSLHRWVQRGVYGVDWCCGCESRRVRVPMFDEIEAVVGEPGEVGRYG